jgi:hypothetical protein
MGQCAWCGSYIKDSADKKALKSFGSMTGLDLLAPLGRKILPQYCSKKCKLEAAQAKGGGESGGGGESSGGGGGGGILGKMMAESVKLSQGTMNAAAALKHIPDTIRFEGTAEDLANTLNDCFSKYQAIPSDLSDVVTMAAQKAAKKALLEKAEFGIMKLRKEDPDTADFFQKKLDEFRNPPKKGLGSLFGNKK